MTTIAEVRAGLAETIEDFTGVKAYGYAPAVVSPPCVFPAGLTVDPATQDGGRQIELALWCCVPATHDQFQERLDGFVIGDESVTAAIEWTPDLGLTGVSAVWVSAGDYGLDEWAGVPLWVARVSVEVAF